MALLTAGMAHIRVDGVTFSTKGEFSATIKNKEFAEIMDSDGAIHYSENNIASIIAGDLTTTADLDMDKLVNATNVVVQVEFKNGKTALLRDAIYTGSAEASAADGTFAVEFKGIGSWVA